MLYSDSQISTWCYFKRVLYTFLTMWTFSLSPSKTSSRPDRISDSPVSRFKHVINHIAIFFSYFMETQTSWCFIGAVVRGYRRGVSKPRKCCPSFITRLKTKFEKVDHNLNKCLHPGGFKISKKFCTIQILGNIFQFYSAWVKFILWTSEFCHCLLA